MKETDFSYKGVHSKSEFNSIEICLDITDPITMMTHHTWIFDIRNLSKVPINSMFYSLDGCSPKDSSELDVKITDEKNNRLEITDVIVNKPRLKEFLVELVIPIEKNQSSLIKLEYDWEEPKRKYEHVLSSKCKKFKYYFSAPKSLEIKHRIFEKRNLGEKHIAEPPATVKYLDERTEIVWETANNHRINPNDTFTFYW